jgi:hypothetical protein
LFKEVELAAEGDAVPAADEQLAQDLDRQEMLQEA